MPVGNTDTVDESLAVGRRPISSTLHDAEVAFQRFLALRGNGGEVTDVRDAAVTIAMLRAYQASLGFNSAQFTRGAASLLGKDDRSSRCITSLTVFVPRLDSSCAITLRREFYEALAVRKRGARVEEMVWPEVVPGPVDQTDEMLQVEESGETLDNSRSESARRSRLLEEPDMSRLPSNWCTISINVTEDHNTMFIARRQRDRAPVIFTLPLDRQGKREEEDQSFTLDTAVTELRTIIKESDDSARSAKDVDRTDKSAKMQWWSNRKVLDQRLQDLLENIEFCWLGAFKVCLPVSLSLFPYSTIELLVRRYSTLPTGVPLNHSPSSVKR
jgi:separase